MASFQEPVNILRSVIELLEERRDGKLSSLERDVLRQRLIAVYDMLWDQDQPDTLQTVKSPVIKEAKESREVPVVNLPVEEPDEDEPVQVVDEDALEDQQPENENQGSDDESESSDDRKTSLNERFAGDKTTLADKILKPQGQLKNLIGVNEKFFFTKELFGGDRKAFEEAIERLDACAGLEQALGLIEGEFSSRYDWDSGAKAVDKFMKEVLLRFSR